MGFQNGEHGEGEQGTLPYQGEGELVHQIHSLHQLKPQASHLALLA